MQDELQVLVDRLAVDLHRSVLVEDSGQEPIVASAAIGVVDDERIRSILLRKTNELVRPMLEPYRILQACEPVRVAADEQLGSLDRVCVPIRGQSGLHGFFWLIDRPPLADEEVERTCAAARLAAEVFERLGEAERGRGLLVHDLFASAKETRKNAAHRLVAQGDVLDDPPFSLVVVRTRKPGADSDLVRLQHRMRRAFSHGGVVSVVATDRLLVVLPAAVAADRPAEAIRAAVSEPDDLDLVVGSGGSCPSLDTVTDLLDGAGYAAEVATRVPEFGGTAEWRRLGVYALFQRLDRTEATMERLCPGSTALLAPKQAMYLETVRTYLDVDGDTSAATRLLHVHRSTLYWRLQRVEASLGIDLGDSATRLNLRLALRLVPMLER